MEPKDSKMDVLVSALLKSSLNSLLYCCLMKNRIFRMKLRQRDTLARTIFLSHISVEHKYSV